MVGSSSDSYTSNPTSNSSDSSDQPQESYNVVFGPLRPSTALSLPEAESPEIQYLDTGGPYPARRLPNFDFIPASEGSLLGSIHTRIAALRSSTNNTQTRYSQAINSSIPQDPTLNRNVRMTIANALWNSTMFFAENEAAAQLLRYREMFVYLSQRHAESLASSSLYQAQSFVRRGQIAIAAIRIAGRNQNSFNHSVAQGHHARHSSEVSVWGWKPWREIALAEKISKRRKERAAKEKEKIREKSSRKVRLLRGYSETSQGYKAGREGKMIAQGNPDTKSQAERGVGPQKLLQSPRRENTVKGVHHFYGRHPSSIRKECSSGTSPNPSQSSLGNEGPSTDGANSQEGLIDDPGPPGWYWPKAKEEINWRIPVYHDINSASLAFSPVDIRTGPTMPTIATVTNASDSFLRAHTISEPSGMGYTSSLSSESRPSLQISPKSQASPVALSSNDASGSSIMPTTSSTEGIPFLQLPSVTALTSLSQQSSTSFRKVLLEHTKGSQEGSDNSNSDSTVGASRNRNPLRKVKTVFRSLPLKHVHFPWSSSSEEEGHISTDSSIDPSSSERSWPQDSNIPPAYGLVPPPPQLKYQSYAGFLDEPVSQTRIHSPQPKTSRSTNDPRLPPHPGTRLISKNETSERLPSVRHRESDPLTRTEKEYQEILATLNELKREMRVGSGTRNRGRVVDGGARGTGEERSRVWSRK